MMAARNGAGRWRTNTDKQRPWPQLGQPERAGKVSSKYPPPLSSQPVQLFSQEGGGGSRSGQLPAGRETGTGGACNQQLDGSRAAKAEIQWQSWKLESHVKKV